MKKVFCTLEILNAACCVYIACFYHAYGDKWFALGWVVAAVLHCVMAVLERWHE